jgi:hypothetical protein
MPPATKVFPCHEDCPVLKDTIERLETLEQAFPDGPLPHRSAHEAWIAAKKAEAEFWADLKKEVLKNGTLGLLYLLGALIVVGAAAKLGIHIKS